MIINSTIYGAAAPPLEVISEFFVLWPQDIVTSTIVEFHRSNFAPFMFVINNGSRYSEYSNDIFICGVGNKINSINNFYYIGKNVPQGLSSPRFTLLKRTFQDITFFDDGFRFELDASDSDFLQETDDSYSIYVYGLSN